jgi:RNA polymerase sigma factor (sigma-70 family)
LRSAQSSTRDPQLTFVLKTFRKHWLVFGLKRFPQVRDDHEDAIQAALMKLISSDKLDSLREVERLEAWARGIFVNAILDVLRGAKRHGRWRAYVEAAEGDPEQALREGLAGDGPTPEDLTSYRERLAIVARVTSRWEVARLKFVEDLREKEIAARQGLTRHCVAGQVKRARKALRQAMQDD